MNGWKKRLLITIGVLLVTTMVSVPTVLLLSRLSDDAEQKERQELILAFVQRYGSLATLIEIAEPQDFYIYVWELGGIRYFTLSIDGLFIELGQIGLGEQPEEYESEDTTELDYEIEECDDTVSEVTD